MGLADLLNVRGDYFIDGETLPQAMNRITRERKGLKHVAPDNIAEEQRRRNREIELELAVSLRAKRLAASSTETFNRLQRAEQELKNDQSE